MGGGAPVGGPGGPGSVQMGKGGPVNPNWDVTIEDPTPGSYSVGAAQGKTYSLDADGVREAVADVLTSQLGDVPTEVGTGTMMVSFTVGEDGSITEVNCDAWDEANGRATMEMRPGNPYGHLAGRIASLLSNCTFEPPEDGDIEVRIPLNFVVRPD